MSDYAPNANWQTGGELTAGYDRNPPITDFITIDAGNVTSRMLPITDPGQLGQGNVPGLHFRDSRAGDSHATVPYTAEPTFPFQREARIFRRPTPATYNPYLYAAQDEEHATDNTPRVGSGAGGAWGSSGAPISEGVVEEHGPTTAEALARIAKPAQATAKRPWWRKLTMLPPMDDKGVFPQNVVEAMGKALPDDDAYRPALGSIGLGNTFIIPDIRRGFDDPTNAPGMVPTADGTKILPGKAGYPLTNTPLEGQPWDVQTTHTLPVDPFKDSPSTWISEPNRVRAGVAHDDEGRPSRVPHWFYFAAVDKWAADHAYGVKGMVAQPLISRPIYTQSETSMVDEGSAGGPRYYAPAPGMEAVGISPNLSRQTPQPWDSNIVTPYADTFNDGMASVSHRGANGWRVR